MPALRSLTIIATTLLLLAGAGAGGYYYSNQQGNAHQSASPAVVENGGAPRPFQQIGRAVEMYSRADGQGCRIDLERNTLGCTYADGRTQLMSVDKGTKAVTTRTFTDGESCSESTMHDVFTEAGVDSEDAGGADSPSPSITLLTDSRRVKMWEVSIPKGLLEEANLEDSLDSFQYYEKDGQPWKIEAFEEGENDPLVLKLNTKDTVNKKWSLYGTKADGKCEDTAILAQDKKTGRKLMVTAIAIAVLALAALAVAASCARGRRARQLRGFDVSGHLDWSPKMSSIDWKMVGRGLQTTAAVAAAATVAKATSEAVIGGVVTAAALSA